MSTFNDHIESEVERIREAYAKVMASEGMGMPMIPSPWRETPEERKQRETTERVQSGAIAWWNDQQHYRRPIPAPRVRLVSQAYLDMVNVGIGVKAGLEAGLYTAPAGSPPPRTLDGWTEVRGVR